jgi:hypothetical protein
VRHDAIALFDLKSGKEIYRIDHAGGSIASICISPNNQYFAVGFSKRIKKDTIRLYSLASAQHLQAGLACARASRRESAHVLIVDAHNHHCFQPLLYQVATAALAPNDLAWPVRGCWQGNATRRC